MHMPTSNASRVSIGLFLPPLLFFFALLRLSFAETNVPPAPPHPNVLLVTIDSLRPDHLGCYGYGKPTSPWIDRISREGALFRNAVSSGGWTSPAMVSILTGLYPSVHGVEGRPDGFPCLRQAPLTSWSDAGYRIPGYETINDETNYSNLGFQPDPGYGYTPEQLFSWIKTHRSQPFFCWYHINKTPHLPYRPDDAHLKLFQPPGGPLLTPEQQERLEVVRSKVIIPKGTLPLTDDDLPGILALFDGEVRMADDTVGRIYEFLREEGLLDSTVLILTADQGEELLDHGFIGHASTSWAGTLYEEIIHVPLIIRYPAAISPGMVIQTVVETLDILPTLQALLGIPSPFPFQGRSFLRLLQGDVSGWTETAFAETTPCGYQCARAPEKEPVRLHSVRSGPWKLIATHTPEQTRFALHNLESDPGEKENLLESRPEIANRLKGLLLRQEYRNRLFRKQLLQNCSTEQAP